MNQFLFAQAAAPTAPAPATPAAPAAPAPATPAAPAAPTPATPAAPAANAPALTAAPATGDAVEQVSAAEVQPADNDAAPAQKQPQGSGFGMWIPMLIIFAIFYFLMIKPQQRKEKERRQMIAALRAGARVVFAGGLIGTIVEAKETTFKIEIAGDVVIEVARNAVQGLAAEDKPAEPAKK